MLQLDLSLRHPSSFIIIPVDTYKYIHAMLIVIYVPAVGWLAGFVLICFGLYLPLDCSFLLVFQSAAANKKYKSLSFFYLSFFVLVRHIVDDGIYFIAY